MRALSRGEFLRIVGVAGAWPLLTAGQARRTEADNVIRKKVLEIFVDDMPLGGFTRHTMPNLFDWIVDRGVRFDNGYSIDPWCEPTRASLRKGTYPHNHGHLRGTRLDYDLWRQQKDDETTATRLRAAGVGMVGHVGKYFNLKTPRYVPPGYGWFIDMGRWGNEQDYYTVYENGRAPRDIPVSYHDVEYTFDRAINFVEKGVGDNWYLHVAPNAPHGPPSASVEHRDDFDGIKLPKPPSYDPAGLDEADMRVRYEAMKEECRDIDDGIARLMRALNQTNQLSDTLIIFTSDNGFMYGEHNWTTKAVPWEESVAVPFVVRGQGFAPGSRASVPVGGIDLPYTALSYLGADVSGFDGRDLREYESFAGRHLLIENPYWGWREVTDGNWVYWEYGDEVTTAELEQVGGVLEAERMVAAASRFDTQPTEPHLHYMPDDPYQMNNLAGSPEHAEREALMRERVRAMAQAGGDELRALEMSF